MTCGFFTFMISLVLTLLISPSVRKSLEISRTQQLGLKTPPYKVFRKLRPKRVTSRPERVSWTSLKSPDMCIIAHKTTELWLEVIQLYVQRERKM